MRTLISSSSQDTINAGKRFAEKLESGTVVALHGSLGAGKTTFVKGIAKGLKIEEPITSPTYTIISEYTGTKSLFHMDLYRIDSLEEFELLGSEEMIYGEGITVIEWSEKVNELLPDNKITVTITILSDDKRKIDIIGVE